MVAEKSMFCRFSGSLPTMVLRSSANPGSNSRSASSRTNTLSAFSFGGFASRTPKTRTNNVNESDQLRRLIEMSFKLNIRYKNPDTPASRSMAKRPGVAMTICGRFWSSKLCFKILSPPITTQTLWEYRLNFAVKRLVSKYSRRRDYRVDYFTFRVWDSCDAWVKK